MAERAVAAVFPAGMETIHAGYWKISSRAAINRYHCRRFHRVTPVQRGITNVRETDPLESKIVFDRRRVGTARLADLELLMAEYGEVTGNAATHRLELPVGDEVAAAYYAIEGGGIVFTHTEVPLVFSAQGYGSKLTRGLSKRHVRAGCP